MDSLIHLLILIATLVISFVSYSKIKEFEISPHNKTHLFKWLFPPSIKFPKTTYVGFSILLFLLFLLTKDITWFNVSVFIILLVMQMIITIDIYSHKLPNKYVLPLVLVALVIGTIQNGILETVGGMVVIFVLFLIIGLLRLGSFGGGDLKFGLIIGGLIGSGSISILLLVVCIMFVYSGIFLVIYLMNGFLTRKDFIPMGPFLYLGFLTYVFCQNFIS